MSTHQHQHQHQHQHPSDDDNNHNIQEHFSRSGFREKLRQQNRGAINKLIKICCFCFTFMTIEFIGGYLAGSLAIMSDAAHLLSDLAGFLISMFSLFIACRPANSSLTYGYHRSEVIGALSSILIIWVLTAWLITEAIDRLFHPQPIVGLLMMCIAACGLLFNIIMSQILAYNPLPNAMDGKMLGELEADPEQGMEEPLLGEGRIEGEDEPKCDDNNPVIRAAYIHILGDMIQSFGVLLAASIIYFFQDTHPNIRLVDPICTFIFAIIVLCTTVPVSKQCLNVLMEAAPEEINMDGLYRDLNGVVGVVNVHDIHIWCISVGRPSISLHMLSNSPQKSLEQATVVCKKYGIKHITIQVEDNTQIKRLSYMPCTHVNDNDIH